MLINGHSLHIERFGPLDGRTVILLHHGLGSVRAWKEQISALVGAGYRVIAYDRWGYGASDARPALDLPTFATDVEDLHLIMAKQDKNQVTLVGHSDGGTIALYYAAQYPQQVRCLVTVAAHIYVEPMMEPSILEIKRTFDQDQRFRLGMLHAHGEKYESTFHNWFDGWYRMESLSWDMRPLLAKISCPVWVVQGQNDEHATPQHAMNIAETIPGAELWLVPGATHMLPQEHADLFNEKLLKFLGMH